jgi:hypothetical protein
VYFSFDYRRDLHRVNEIRQLPQIIAGAAAGFQSAKIWQEAKRSGDGAVHGLINDALSCTSVTVVCVGQTTARRKYVTYELERSLERGNGLVGITINHLSDGQGNSDPEASIPPLLTISGASIYKYSDRRTLVNWIEQAAEAAARERQHDYQRQLVVQGSLA